MGTAEEDKPHELDAAIQKYHITQAGFGGMNHLCPDMEIGLKEGWTGLLEKVRYYRKRNRPADVDFYEGEEQLLLGILEWVKAHQELAEQKAAVETEPFLKENYLEIARINGALCKRPPETFREAVPVSYTHLDKAERSV